MMISSSLLIGAAATKHGRLTGFVRVNCDPMSCAMMTNRLERRHESVRQTRYDLNGDTMLAYSDIYHLLGVIDGVMALY